MTTPRQLFVSHAADDLPLVEGFVDLVESGVGVPAGDIFCSSLKGQNIKPGTSFVTSVREHLDGATCVLALVSPAFYASAFCMCELGGTWLQAKSFLPVLVPPIEYDKLKAVLEGIHVSKINTEADLDELYVELKSRLSFKAHETPRWNSKKTKFMAALPELLKRCSFKGPVDRATHDKVLQQLEEYKRAIEDLERKNEKLAVVVEDLKKQKDREAVQEVVSKHSTSQETFKRLVKAAAKTLEVLYRATREALYYRSRSEEYFPGEEGWDDVKVAKEHGEIWHDEDTNQVGVREQHARVASAIKALDALDRWLGSAPDDFEEWYQSEYKDEQPKLELRQFWEEHF